MVEYALPSACRIEKDGKAYLTAEQEESWREQGFCLVQGLISDEFSEKCRQEAQTAFENNNITDFGSDGKMEFPTGYENCDQLTLHPNFLAVAAHLLKVPQSEVRLIQSDVWPKLGVQNTTFDPLANKDQRIHCDYGNNTLTHPPDWYAPECVAMIVYLSESSEAGGGTAVSPRRGPDDPAYQGPIIAMPGYGGLPFINDKSTTEEYMQEHQPEFFQLRQGTVLVYRHDVWHRGTTVIPGKLRIVMNLGYKRQDAQWVTTWNPGFARKMYYGFVEKMLANCTVEQRTALGFPAPGHTYWNEATLKAVEARFAYAGFDMGPYRKAFEQRKAPYSLTAIANAAD